MNTRHPHIKIGYLYKFRKFSVVMPDKSRVFLGDITQALTYAVAKATFYPKIGIYLQPSAVTYLRKN